MKMKRLIIISGDLAAGKSTLARELSKQINIPSFIKDDMKEIGCDVIGFNNRDENYRISRASVQEMIYSFSRLAEVGYDAILEANFRNDETEKILKIANDNGYKIYAYNLIGDINLLYDRFLKRLETRHRAHTTLHLEESIEKFADVILTSRINITGFNFKTINITNVSTSELVKLIKEDINI